MRYDVLGGRAVVSGGWKVGYALFALARAVIEWPRRILGRRFAPARLEVVSDDLVRL
jgi:hypothetical protein